MFKLILKLNGRKDHNKCIKTNPYVCQRHAAFLFHSFQQAYKMQYQHN